MFIYAYVYTLHGKNACSSLTACLLSTPALLTWSPGQTFDRQASVRRSLINTDTLARRPKKVKRRKTISGLPDNVQQELGMVWLCKLPPLLLLPCLPSSRLSSVVFIIFVNVRSFLVLYFLLLKNNRIRVWPSFPCPAPCSAFYLTYPSHASSFQCFALLLLIFFPLHSLHSSLEH